MPEAVVCIITGVILTAGVMVLYAHKLSQCTFVCKECGNSFRISWRRALWIQHFNRDYILICPLCGKKGWCRAKLPEKRGEEQSGISKKL